MPLRFLILFLALASTHCSVPWTNTHNRVAVDCQISREDAHKKFLQILDDKGNSLSFDQRSALVAEFLGAEGQRLHPRITPGACIEIPDKAGQLAVIDSKSKAAVYWRTNGQADRFQTRQLIKRPQFTYETLCQGENRFAHTQLKRDWSVTTEGSLQNFRLQVQARNVHDQQVIVLFQKEFGEELMLPESWSTADLREGQYHVEVLQQDLTEGLEQAPRLVSFSALCPLTVLHHAPTLLGLADGTLGVTVVDLDRGLEWTSPQNNAEIHVCMEERSAVPQDLQSGNSCQAVAQCQDPAQFKPMSKIRPDREGIFNVFAYAKDPADNKGETACQTVIFSTQAPIFDVRWSTDRWNREGAVLDEPVPILKAKVSGLYHKDIPAEQLQESLECKAEVILRSVETVATPSITCTEGRCKGLSLDIFRPCDSDIGIGIYEYWRSTYSRHATLRLKMRASDLAGHVREKTLNLVLDGEQWQRLSIDLPPDISLPPYSLAEDADGRLLGLGKYVGIWKDDKFSNISPGNGLVEPVRTKDNEIYFFKGDKPSELQIMRWLAGNWQPLAGPLNFEDKYPITLSHPQEGFWLFTAQHSYLIQGNQVKEAPLPPEGFGHQTQVSMDESGRIWAFSGDQVHSLENEGSWQRFTVPKINGSDEKSEYSYLVDRYTHLWMIVSDKSTSPPLVTDIVRIDGEQQQPYPDLIQKVTHATLMANSFILDAHFTPMIGKYRWSEKSLSWELNPLFEGIADHVDVASFWNSREMTWTTLEGRTYLEHEGQLKQLPLPMSLGEMPFISRNKDVFVTGFTAFSRLQWRPWNDRNAELDDMENVLGIWPGKNGNIRTCSSMLKIWELREGIWSSLLDLSRLDSGIAYACYEDAASNLFMHTSTSIWWLPFGKKTPLRLADSAKGNGPDGFVQDTAGIVWFACQDQVAKAALCSFDKNSLEYHPLRLQSFDHSRGRSCSLDVGEDLFLIDKDFSVVYRRDTRILQALDQESVTFPDGRNLLVDSCYRIGGASFLVLSDDIYYLWNNQSQQLRVLENFDSGISRSLIMPEQITFQPSADGFLYLMALEAKDQLSESTLLSEKIRRGFVYQLNPEGTLTEILSPEIRIRAFDKLNEMPQMLFTDRYGMLWGLSMSSIYWKQKLIQFTIPISVGH